MKAVRVTLAAIVLLGIAGRSDAQTLTGASLVNALRSGGHVIVMRHGSSPSAIPATPNPDNVPPERQLDEQGRTSTTAMGDALRRLKIPIGEVLTSPTYRARETATRAGMPAPRSATELGEGSGSMQAVSPAQTEWLQQKVTELPRGTNVVLITHSPNVSAAFPEAATVAQGEAVIFAPDGKGGTRVVGRIRIEEWPGFR